MAALKWDENGTRLYETGISNVALFVIGEDGEYDNGVAWSGVTAITESPSGAEDTALYADNIKYLNLKSAEEFGATIEAYYYPDEFMECDGSLEPVTGMVIGQQTRKNFGLAYKTLLGNDSSGNDHSYKLHFIYGASAKPSERAYNTVNDSPEANTFSYEITTTPVQVGTINGVTYKPTACITIDASKFTEAAAKAKLKALEDYVFGTASGQPTMPTPAKIYELLTTTPTAG